MKIKEILLVYLLIALFSRNSVAQKKEMYGWGQYTEVECLNYQNYPYTLFNRVQGTPLDSQISNIKRLIIGGQKLTPSSNYQNEIAEYYNGLYEFAVSPRPDARNENSRINWAKARAFVRYIGLYKDGTLLEPQDRLDLAQGAENALKEMITEVPSDPNKLLIPSR